MEKENIIICNIVYEKTKFYKIILCVIENIDNIFFGINSGNFYTMLNIKIQ